MFLARGLHVDLRSLKLIWENKEHSEPVFSPKYSEEQVDCKNKIMSRFDTTIDSVLVRIQETFMHLNLYMQQLLAERACLGTAPAPVDDDEEAMWETYKANEVLRMDACNSALSQLTSLLVRAEFLKQKLCTSNTGSFKAEEFLAGIAEISSSLDKLIFDSNRQMDTSTSTTPLKDSSFQPRPLKLLERVKTRRDNGDAEYTAVDTTNQQVSFATAYITHSKSTSLPSSPKKGVILGSTRALRCSKSLAANLNHDVYANSSHGPLEFYYERQILPQALLDEFDYASDGATVISVDISETNSLAVSELYSHLSLQHKNDSGGHHGCMEEPPVWRPFSTYKEQNTQKLGKVTNTVYLDLPPVNPEIRYDTQTTSKKMLAQLLSSSRQPNANRQKNTLKWCSVSRFTTLLDRCKLLNPANLVTSETGACEVGDILAKPILHSDVTTSGVNLRGHSKQIVQHNSLIIGPNGTKFMNCTDTPRVAISRISYGSLREALNTSVVDRRR